MNRTNRIRIFYFTIAILACLFFYMGYRMVNDYQEREKAKEQLVAKETEEETNMPIANVEIPYEYVIVEEEGYLLVYMQDLKTVYMYTDIRMDELDETLQKEIKKGKTFSTLEELYDFLENYSS